MGQNYDYDYDYYYYYITNGLLCSGISSFILHVQQKLLFSLLSAGLPDEGKLRFQSV